MAGWSKLSSVAVMQGDVGISISRVFIFKVIHEIKVNDSNQE